MEGQKSALVSQGLPVHFYFLNMSLIQPPHNNLKLAKLPHEPSHFFPEKGSEKPPNRYIQLVFLSCQEDIRYIYICIYTAYILGVFRKPVRGAPYILSQNHQKLKLLFENFFCNNSTSFFFCIFFWKIVF